MPCPCGAVGVQSAERRRNKKTERGCGHVLFFVLLLLLLLLGHLSEHNFVEGQVNHNLFSSFIVLFFSRRGVKKHRFVQVMLKDALKETAESMLGSQDRMRRFF